MFISCIFHVPINIHSTCRNAALSVRTFYFLLGSVVTAQSGWAFSGVSSPKFAASTENNSWRDCTSRLGINGMQKSRLSQRPKLQPAIHVLCAIKGAAIKLYNCGIVRLSSLSWFPSCASVQRYDILSFTHRHSVLNDFTFLED